jgi:hypothetical protein
MCIFGNRGLCSMYACQKCKTENRWHSVEAYIEHILTIIVCSITVWNESNNNNWQPMNRFYVWSFQSRPCVVSQIEIHHQTWFSFFSLISMIYHDQCPKTQPCAPGLSGELCSWTHGWIQYDSRHTDRLILHTDRSFYTLYDITNLNLISQFQDKFSLCFPTYQ